MAIFSVASQLASADSAKPVAAPYPLDPIKVHHAAPGELRSDMKVLVDVAQALISALDPTAKDKTIPDFASEFDRVREASANVTRFAADNCGVQLESTSTAGPATLPPGTPSSAP